MRIVMLLLAPLWFYAHAAAVAQSATTENADSDRTYEVVRLLDDARMQPVTRIERIRLMQDSITIATALSGEREGWERAKLMRDVVQGDPQLRSYAGIYQEANAMAIASILACKGEYDASIKIIKELKDLSPSAVDFAAHCALERNDYAEATRLATLTTDVNSFKLMAEIATAEYAGHVDPSSSLARLKELESKIDQSASTRYLAMAEAGTGRADRALARIQADRAREKQRGTAYGQSSQVSHSLWLTDVAVAAYRASGAGEGLRIAAMISERSDRAVALAHMSMLAAFQGDRQAAALDNAAAGLLPAQQYPTSPAYDQTSFGMAQDMLIISRARRNEIAAALELLRQRQDSLTGNCEIAAYVASAASGIGPRASDTLSESADQACKVFMLRTVANQLASNGAQLAPLKQWASAHSGFLRSSIEIGIAEGIVRKAHPSLFELKYLNLPLRIAPSNSNKSPNPNASTLALGIPADQQQTSVAYSVEKAGDELFGRTLVAQVGGQRRVVIPKAAGKCMQIIAQKDFAGNRSIDALVSDVTGCGGNCCSDSFFFVARLTNGHFEVSKEFGDSWEGPVIENWNGQWTVVVAAIDQAGNPTGTRQRFILKNGHAVKVEERHK